MIYDSILCDIAAPDERDEVSSRGWALGYLGGGLLLAINLAVVTLHGSFGLDKAPRGAVLPAQRGTLVGRASPSSRTAGIRDRPPVDRLREPGGLVRQSFGQLSTTLRGMRAYPMTLLFLVAYLFFNDGIQTVITAASTYGEKQLGLLHVRADRDHPAGAVRRLRRGAAVRPARRPLGRPPHDPLGTGGLDGDRRHSVRAARPPAGALPRARGRDRHRPRRHPGALPLATSASSSRAVGRPSTSASTRPANAAPAGSARWSSAWCTRSPARTGPRSSRWSPSSGSGSSC